MKNNEILTRTVIELLTKAVLEKKRINIRTSNNIFNTYDDASGQRGTYLSFFSWGKEGINIESPHKLEPEVFYVRRKLTFTNPGDGGGEGKNDAILLRITGAYIKNAKEINISDVMIDIDGLIISIFEY